MKNEKSKTKNLSIVLFQIFSMILSIISFSFILGGMIIGVANLTSAVDTTPFIPKGCCLESNDGSICQDMNNLDAANCKTNLLATSCSNVDSCQAGCCYDAKNGICSLNSPKGKCLANGGNWSNDANCNIQQCSIGCCVVGEQAMTKTDRECTLVSKELNVAKNFQPINEDGTCNSYIGLSKKGACTSPASDFSGENDCKFTTKEQCGSGNFYEGFLCTAPELKTNCFAARNTTCVEDKDQVFYVDTCGNLANVYDANKFNDTAYWTKVSSPSDSSVCSTPSKDCGNCDYISGSVCNAFRQGQDIKPSFGDNVCRNLNCENGKKHGESWCISDYSNTNSFGISPVGSRFFKGICMDGEISVEPCADFNNEICIENSLSAGAGSFSEAKCIGNDWRICVAANKKESYNEVAEECKKSDQCIMFNDIPGNDKYKDLAGFKKDKLNSEQGDSNGLAKDANKVITYCVPKYIPGMVFWQSTNSSKNSNSNPDYGGSLEETKAVCALGSFTCVTKYAKYNALSSWQVKDNAECWYDGEPDKTLNWYEGLQDRCSKLGPCGIQVNIAGEFGSNNESTIAAYQIDGGGDSSKESTSAYVLKPEYKNSIKTQALISKPGSLKTLASVAFLSLITGRIVGPPMAVNAQPMLLGTDTAAGASSFAGLGSVLYSMGVYAIVGYTIGQLVGKIFGMSDAETTSLSYALGAGGLALGTMYTGIGTEAAGATAFGEWLTVIGGLGWCWICLVIVLVVMILTYIFTYTDVKYYVVSYSCQPWSPPMKGDCASCNNDVRTCSEYRCRSLGQNCKYFNTNGEPGWCAESKDIWSAKITPWQSALTDGNKYIDIADNHFTIASNSSDGKIKAWQTLQFGIITDKPSQCKIDNKHTSSFSEMSTSMVISNENCKTGTCSQEQGLYHKVALSDRLISSAESTLPMIKGENTYYIRCQNYAGQSNDAEFAVRLVLGEGDDLTPPLINSFTPPTNSYVKLGANSSSVLVYVNEPSSCRYSQGFNMRYEEMAKNLTCITNPSMAILGNWPCYATLENLKVGENKFYFKCQDQPTASATTRKNTDEVGKDYTLNLCSTGLNITSITPRDTLITGKAPLNITLSVETSGCIEDGKSICYYRFANGTDIAFLNTNSKTHSQLFDSLPSGDNNISIICIDDAGNTARDSVNINVFVDNQAPSIVRAYQSNDKLIVLTDENAECRYHSNSSIGCSFNFDAENNLTSMDNNGLAHYAPWIDNKNYYIKCSDVFGNTNLNGCALALKTY